MRFVKLDFGHSHTVGVNLATEHGTVAEFIVALSGTLTSVVGKGPFKGVGIDVLVGMGHSWFGGCGRGGRLLLLLLMIQCDRSEESGFLP